MPQDGPACASAARHLAIQPAEIWDTELSDQRLLELLLLDTLPPGEGEPLVCRLLAEYGDIQGLLSAAPDRLRQHGALRPEVVHQLKLAQAIGLRLGRIRMQQCLTLGRFDAVVEYLRMRLARSPIEHLWALFLNARCGLIAEEEHARGTINHTPAYPREIVKRALEHGAAGVVLVHNHPSGDAKPSARDINLTSKVRAALATVDIRLHDHIIITEGDATSLAALGHLG
ncbi:RadC family protein [Acuticoccus sp. I52.16.1]|uniref:JAB domain-containing protein n=1 Tax=Acuticoccus sp. I52.16.1 TaxID=2928472 RepID=UPI001FD22FDF|nr:DNA repair protein RadC [Acuticoccus sp. I52.16.1]UOM35608.1 DNA repair protein RadC [Acuticoccus sp. I52.16.1]